jgi:hypothetical protein
MTRSSQRAPFFLLVFLAGGLAPSISFGETLTELLVSPSCGTSGKACKVDEVVTLDLFVQNPGSSHAPDLGRLSVLLKDRGTNPGNPVCLDLYKTASPAASDSTQFKTSLLKAFDDGRAGTARAFKGRLAPLDNGSRPMALVFADGTACRSDHQSRVLAEVPISVDFSGLYGDGRWQAPELALENCTQGTKHGCQAGDRLLVGSNELRAWLQGLSAKPADLHLYIDGVQFPGSAEWAPLNSSEGKNVAALEFHLDRSFPADPDDPKNLDTAPWVRTYSRHPERVLQLPAAVGRDGTLWPTDKELRLDTRRIAFAALGILLVPIVLLTALVRSKALIARDQSLLAQSRKKIADLDQGKKDKLITACPILPRSDWLLPPVSMASTLTIWWTTIIALACAYACYMTKSLNVVNSTAGALLGTSVLTCAGASLANRLNPNLDDIKKLDADMATEIDAVAGGGDSSKLEALIAQARNQILVSASLGKDLFCEFDAKIADLHRIQVLFLSFVVSVWYVLQINRLGALPALSDTMLGMLGISSGAYLGFKLKSRD